MKLAHTIALLALSVPAFTPIAVAGLANPKTKWTFQTDGPIRGSAVVSGDQVYFGSADGCLYAANKADGSLAWKFQTGGVVAGAPAVAGPVTVVSGRGEYAHAVDTATGAPLWSFKMQADVPAENAWNFFTAPPVVDGDQVLVGSGDGNLYALDLKTGKLRWKFQTADSIRAAALVVGDTIYQPSGDDYVHVLSSGDGSLKWKYATEGTTLERGLGFMRSDIFTKPSLQNGLLVFGSRDANVYAVDIATHEKKWSFKYGSTWAMSTAVDSDTVYVGWSTNRMVCALDLETGEKKWEYQAGAHTYTTALLLGDDVYWGCADGNIYNFDKNTGTKNWTYRVGSDVYSSIIEDGGTLYFGADDGRLLAVDEALTPSHKAVFFPDNIPRNAGGFVVDAAIAPYLVERGYQLLDSTDSLIDFISTRTEDGDRSVVVFAYAQVPQAALGEDPSTGPMRAYLEAGGKVVWLGGTAFMSCFDDAGNFTQRDPSFATRLLDMKFVRLEDGGNYYSLPTQEGRNWGFPAWLKTSWASLAPGNDITPLATNEYGNVGAWLKSFHPRHGSGWVSFCTPAFGVLMNESELELLERVASYTMD